MCYKNAIVIALEKGAITGLNRLQPVNLLQSLNAKYRQNMNNLTSSTFIVQGGIFRDIAQSAKRVQTLSKLHEVR